MFSFQQTINRFLNQITFTPKSQFAKRLCKLTGDKPQKQNTILFCTKKIHLPEAKTSLMSSECTKCKYRRLDICEMTNSSNMLEQTHFTNKPVISSLTGYLRYEKVSFRVSREVSNTRNMANVS